MGRVAARVRAWFTLCRLWRPREGGADSLDRFRPASTRQRLLRLAAVYLAAVAVCGFLDLRGFDWLEQFSYDIRLGTRAASPGPSLEWARDQVVLVTLSNETFKQLPGPPVPRDHHVKVIRDLTRAGAKAIVFDLRFDQPKPEDHELAAAAKESGRVLWPCYFENEGTPDQKLILPTPELLRACHRYGHIRVPRDPDRPAVDAIEPVMVQGQEKVPALSVEAALMALGAADAPIKRVAGGWQAGDVTIPVDSRGRLRITYVGEPGKAFPPVPYEQVYNGTVDDPSGLFRDKIVLIGDTTTQGNDLSITPVGDMCSVEMHAHALATVLGRGFIYEQPLWLNLLVLALLAVLVAPLAALCSPCRAALGAAVLVGGYGILNAWLFVDRGIWLHLVGPSAAVLLTAGGMLVERGLTDERDKSRMRGLLSRYLSPQTAEYVLANPNACVLGGRRVLATVFFADVRGFTPLAARLAPEVVVARLNEVFQAVTDVVFRYEGTVDKYIGDCVMAVFGAPVPYADHARRAVAAALDVQAALAGMQARWREENLPVLELCIGINTGEMVVGNLGASQRLDFTVIGDAVNLAQRVESLNRDLGTHILITDAVFDALGGRVRVGGKHVVSITGREGEVTVFEVLGLEPA